MMTIREYARPATLEEAWQLNQKKPNRVLGGMLWLKMEKINVGTAIDLSALGLDTIEETDTEIIIGAMATLLISCCVLYPLGVFVTTGLNPMKFLKKMAKVGVFGFSVNSSCLSQTFILLL